MSGVLACLDRTPDAGCAPLVFNIGNNRGELVNLAQVVKTSALVDPAKFKGTSKVAVAALPSLALIETEIAEQVRLKGRMELFDTNLVIEGAGSDVVLASRDKMAALESGVEAGGSATLIELDSRSKPRAEPVLIASNSGKPAAPETSNSNTENSPVAPTPSSQPADGGVPPAGGGGGTQPPVVAPPVVAPPVGVTPVIPPPAVNPPVVVPPVVLPPVVQPPVIQPPVVLPPVVAPPAVDPPVVAPPVVPPPITNPPVVVPPVVTPPITNPPVVVPPVVTPPVTDPPVVIPPVTNPPVVVPPVVTPPITNPPVVVPPVVTPPVTNPPVVVPPVVTPPVVEPVALLPITAPSIAVVDPSAGGLTGKFEPSNKLGSLLISADVAADEVKLKNDNGIQVDATITANKLTSDSKKATAFNGIVRADTIEAKSGQTLRFSQAIGARSMKLEAPIVSAVSINAQDKIEIKGAFSPFADTAALLRAPVISISSGIDASGANGALLPLLPASVPGAGGTVVLESDSLLIDTAGGGIGGINANGGDAVLTSLNAGGDGGTIHLGTEARPIVGNVTVKKAISATSGANATALQHGGKGGTISVVSGGTIAVQANIKASDAATGRASRSGGNIRLDSRKTSGTAISVSNSGQVLSLLSAAAPGPGGKIEFSSAGGDILVSGGVIQADKGSVDIRNTGASGKIDLTNATLRGDVVKVGALGANGQLLIGGGAIDADSAIKLYANGANGTVRFKDNVSLNGTSVKTIAGNTVTVDNGKTVTVNGSAPAQVFTNNPNYTGSGGNGATSGKFGGKGAATQPFGNRPGY